MPRTFTLAMLLAAPAAASAGFTFATIDAPGAVWTTASGINDSGQVVGWSQAAPYGPPSGFLLSGGSFATVTPGSFTVLNGINDSGQVVGSYGYGSPTDGFLLSPSGALETIHALPRANSANGIDSAGTVIGSGFDGFGFPASFKGTAEGGYVTPAGSPIISTTLGIDSAGNAIVGRYSDALGAVHGFLLTVDGLTTIDVPGAANTEARGVNDLGQVVGDYTDGSGTHGFSLVGGVFYAIAVPGSVSTEALGVNDVGQVVGGYEEASGLRHGFLMSPTIEAMGPVSLGASSVPEPSSWVLALVGAAVIGLSRHTRGPGALSGRAYGTGLSGSSGESPDS